MKRSEMFEKIEVFCPTCPETSNRREINKSSYKGDLDKQPYIQGCRSCSMKQRTMSQEARDKISKSNLHRKLSEDDSLRKSEFMKSHPELWEKNLKPELGPLSRIGTHHDESTKIRISKSRSGGTVSDDVKKKISESMKKRSDKS